jgi:hypothetical protein
VNNRQINYLDFEVDKLTRSIENAVTNDSFETEVLNFTARDAKSVNKTKGWLFNWKEELSLNDREVHKLVIRGNQDVVQGLVSMRIESDHVYMPLIESAPFNRGREKMYLGVPGNLVAYVCRISFQKGFEGFVSFHSKTKLIQHYEKSLGARHFGGHLMVIDTAAAVLLVNTYFKS